MPGLKDFVNGAPLLEADLDDYLAKQVVMVYDSAAARDADATLTAALREGMVVFLKDTNTLVVYTGAAWSTIGPVHGALTTWTPTVSQSAGATPIALTNTLSRYAREGRKITAHFDVTLLAAGTAGQPMLVTLPFAAAGNANLPVGLVSVFDASAAAFISTADRLIINTSTTVAVVNTSLTNAGTTTTLAVNDVLRGTVTYEASADA